LSYDEAKTDEERSKCLQDIHSFYLSHLTFNHQKPDDLNKRAGADSESSEAEDGAQGAFGFMGAEKKVHDFDSDKYFSRENVMS